MKIKEIAEAINGQVVVEPAVDVELNCAFAADLMSDILVFGKPQMLMITGLVNPQALRTAEMSDMPVIVFVRGKRPPESMLDLARNLGLGIILSPYTMYETAGRLYQAGLPGLGQLPITQQQ
jgi:serine kinase of HPr protein (carbohydrate metabolism regulator)